MASLSDALVRQLLDGPYRVFCTLIQTVRSILLPYGSGSTARTFTLQHLPQPQSAQPGSKSAGRDDDRLA